MTVRKKKSRHTGLIIGMTLLLLAALAAAAGAGWYFMVYLPGRPDGTQNNAVPFPDDLQLAHSLKIQIAGQTNGAVIAVFKNGYSSHHFLLADRPV